MQSPRGPGWNNNGVPPFLNNMLRGLYSGLLSLTKLIHLAQLPTMQGDQDMSDDNTDDPQAIDPPTNTGGGGSTTATVPPPPLPLTGEEEEVAEPNAIDPPTNTGGGT